MWIIHIDERKTRKEAGKEILFAILSLSSVLRLNSYYFISLSSAHFCQYCRDVYGMKKKLHCHLPFQLGNFIKKNIYVNVEFQRSWYLSLCFLGVWNVLFWTLLILSAHPQSTPYIIIIKSHKDLKPAFVSQHSPSYYLAFEEIFLLA